MASGAAHLYPHNQGHHLHWMVLTQGVVDPLLVAEALGRSIESAVIGLAVRAWNPDLGTYEDMVQVRAPPPAPGRACERWHASTKPSLSPEARAR